MIRSVYPFMVMSFYLYDQVNLPLYVDVILHLYDLVNLPLYCDVILPLYDLVNDSVTCLLG